MSPKTATNSDHADHADDANHAIVARPEWLRARKALLEREKELSRLRDDLAQRRRDLPWVRIDKNYLFVGPKGVESLSDLFRGRSQLIVYHFMFGPEWSEGCPGCSFVSDHVDGAIPHLEHRDVTWVAVSRAPIAKIEAFKKRMGWRFPWFSSSGSSFNFDFGVSASDEAKRANKLEYNYEVKEGAMDEMPGASVFIKAEDGTICHTYSAYARGLELQIGTYQWLDLLPKGRDEEGLAFPMAWLRHHDRYGPDYAVDPNATFHPPLEKPAPAASS